MRISDWSSDVCSSDLGVASVRQEAAFGHVLQECDREWFVATDIRHFPRLGGVGDIAVGQQHNRGHILRRDPARLDRALERSEEHTSELQSLMRISYAVFCLKKKKTLNN